MGGVLSFLAVGAIAPMLRLTVLRLLNRLFGQSSPPLPRSSPTLITLPADILGIILQMLYDTSDPEEIGGYDEEISAGSRLFHLSGTCRYMRAETMPWIFREVYNWSRADGDVWPETLWPFIR